MRISISHLRAAGLTDSQIVNVLEEADAERREKARIIKRNQRARPPDRVDTQDIQDTALSLSKEEKVSPKAESKKVRKENKHSLPENWQPIGPQRDPSEAEEFRDNARAKGWKYANWDAAYRNFQRSSYNARNKNGQQPATDLAAGQAEWERYQQEQIREQLNGKKHETGVRQNTGMGETRTSDKGELRPEGGRTHGKTVKCRQVTDAVFAFAGNLRATR